MLASTTGLLNEDLIKAAVNTVLKRTNKRPLSWYSDGGHSYCEVLTKAYREVQPRIGRGGRPRLVVPSEVSLTQTIRHDDVHGRLLSVEIRATLGHGPGPAGTSHVERLNGALRDRLAALTRKTHAFAKRDATFDALLALQLFDHNFRRGHPALRREQPCGRRRYQQRSPALVLGLTDHLWSFEELLTVHLPLTP